MNPDSNYFQIEEVKGQEVALTYLRSFLKNPDRIPGVLIFHGPDGVGKWFAAERFARQLLCLNQNSCGACESCRLFMRGDHPDFIQFPRNKNIAIGKDKDPEDFTIRWLLGNRIVYKPHVSNRRIVLFPEAQRINNEAETTLLKTLEEPPPHTKFILIVNDLNKLKKTIVSRSVCIPFEYIPQDMIRSLTRSLDKTFKEYYGGSLNPFEIPEEVIEEWHTVVKDHCHDQILILKLENWVREQMTDKKQSREKIANTDFLEMICLLLLYEYRKENFDANIRKVHAILDFKSKLHYNIPALEYFLLSQLFLRLSTSPR
jgi:DNA polymerase-3 subunit gamma/tau